MQEGTAEWDPQFVSHDPGWAIRIYIIYSLFATIYVAAKSILLIRALWLRRIRPNLSEDHIAKAALSGRIHERDSTSTITANFEFVAANIDADIRALMRCSGISFIAALLALTIGLINTFHGVSNSRATGFGAICGGISESLTSAAIGLFVCLAAYFMASIFDYRLARNRTKWRYATSLKL